MRGAVTVRPALPGRSVATGRAVAWRGAAVGAAGHGTLVGMSDCLFCRIVAGEIPSDKVAETDTVVAFRDISPKAPTHVQVIPKTHYPDAAAMVAGDPGLAAEVLALATSVARAEGLADTGYRLMFNTGRDAGQEVFHVHLHVLGGKPLGPMLCD